VKLSRLILAPALTVALLAGPVATADAAAPRDHFKNNEIAYLQDIHGLSPAATRRYTDRYLVNAGYFACHMRNQELHGQIGKARDRIIQHMNAEENVMYFKGRQPALARNIVKIVNGPWWMGESLCPSF
jgi:hypothetical protein